MLIPTIHPLLTPALKGRGTFLLPFFGGEPPKKGLNISPPAPVGGSSRNLGGTP